MYHNILAMTKLENAVENCKAQMKKMSIPCNAALLTSLCKSMGPSLYKRDAAFVAAKDKKEIDTIKKNFITKKLGEKSQAKADGAIAYAIEKIGPSNRHKQRAVFYYLIVKKLKKEAKFK